MVSAICVCTPSDCAVMRVVPAFRASRSPVSVTVATLGLLDHQLIGGSPTPRPSAVRAMALNGSDSPAATSAIGATSTASDHVPLLDAVPQEHM
jgi:hypothetical protein